VKGPLPPRRESVSLLTLALACALALPAVAAPRRAPARAVEQLAEQVAAQAVDAGAQSPVGVFARGESAELAFAFVTLLSSSLAARGLAPVPVDAADPVRAEAAARAGGHRSLLRVQLGLEGGLLHARGDLLGTWVNFWSGAQPTRPASPAAGLESSVDADAHALALAAAPLRAPLPAAVTGPQTGELRLLQGTFARLPKWTAAVAAGDLDGDGKDEVLVLTDDELLAFAPDGKLLGRRELRHLPASPTPVREPFGALAVLRSPARVAYLSAQRTRGELLALEPGRGGFRVLGATEDAPVAALGEGALWARPEQGKNTFAPGLLADGAEALALPRPFTFLSSAATPSGQEVLAVLPDGTALWRSDTGPGARTLELSGVGAGAALVDLDGDGHPELVTSEAAFSPSPEVLRVLRAPSLGASSSAAEAVRFRKELPRGRILQVAGADLEGTGAKSLIVAVWLPDGGTELQVYRRMK
jgi:hypothetical protein